ncbi:hypothetical protein Misp01_52340 [Microtetraspora sp. NBRC 13810]|uniref:DUF397 domain-containing protein n=1 Tax=Microtetraspora sp. NBRC 13810 TaxID=3030990 RepID=UPI0025533AE3|nr:DUF397 domain-containing protein [Microtetraspora sp. NBRC 13810]GLW10105.1 hypothetical protein Misp01_52340 [Microtetraspora sp. NBRC 13810]
MTIENGDSLVWRKSSYSGGGNDCVEVAEQDEMILVRDSKDPGGPVLRFTGREWFAFWRGMKAGEFDGVGRLALE